MGQQLHTSTEQEAWEAWQRTIESLDWQSIDERHQNGQAIVVRADDGVTYAYAYWGQNEEEWGWPKSADDAASKWRLASDSRIGEPLEYIPTEAAEPTEFLRRELGE